MGLFWNETVFLISALMFLAQYAPAQDSYSVFSPNRQIELRIRVGERFQYDVLFKRTPLLQNSTFSITFRAGGYWFRSQIRSHEQAGFLASIEDET